jgi:DNA modification methylase
MITIKQGDCLELMGEIPDRTIDLILCDLPYGVLNKSNDGAKWDSVIPFDELWEQYKRIIKDDGNIVLFGSGLFTAKLMLSNEQMWRYNLIWKKGNRCSGFLNANRQPLRNHEDICVFYKQLGVYNPQFVRGAVNHSKGNIDLFNMQNCYGEFKQVESRLSEEKFPISILDFDKEHPQKYHPTQKPVALLEYLIKTYSNEGDTVLDNCMGSGSTGVACLKTNRKFIGYEMDDNHFATAQERLRNVII